MHISHQPPWNVHLSNSSIFLNLDLNFFCSVVSHVVFIFLYALVLQTIVTTSLNLVLYSRLECPLYNSIVSSYAWPTSFAQITFLVNMSLWSIISDIRGISTITTSPKDWHLSMSNSSKDFPYSVENCIHYRFNGLNSSLTNLINCHTDISWKCHPTHSMLEFDSNQNWHFHT